MKRSAIISECGRYRYLLRRDLDTNNDRALGFIMLNPSTADAEQDDATIRRCVAFARRGGYDALLVGNLFAFRATNPMELRNAFDPIGPENTSLLRMILYACTNVVFAWGSTIAPEEHRHSQQVALVVEIFREIRPLCLGVTKRGHPRHPLYIRATQPLVPFDNESTRGRAGEGDAGIAARVDGKGAPSTFKEDTNGP